VKENDLYDDLDDEEQNRDLPEFSREELKQLGRAGETGQGGVGIDRCVLEQVRIASADIDISIYESVFGRKVDFKKGVCRGRLNFWDANFHRKADFTGAIFKEAVHFEDCMFDRETNFSGSVFERNVAFTSCDFKGKVVFDDARFMGEVDLSESTFQKKVSCKGALFEKTVDLDNVRFQESPDTTDSNLADMKREGWAENEGHKKRYQKTVKPKTEFNPWRELDKASKKSMSRRDLLRGLFRFLPEKDEK
jgi:uncharacterized protein YjbI with pentapeptide repeats